MFKRLIVGLFATALVSFVAFSSHASDEIRIGTGKENGVYHSVAGKILKQQLGKVPVSLVTSNGSLENLDRLKSGEIDIAFMQFDTLVNENLTIDFVVIKRMYPEYVHMIVKENGIDSITKLEAGKSKIAIGPDGSGTWVTWKSFCKSDKSYDGIATLPIGSTRALSALESGEIDAVLLIGGLGVGDAMRAEKDRDKFKLANVDDWDFNNTMYKKEKVYDFVPLTSKTYPNLIGGFFGGSKETIKVDAVLVTTAKWADTNSGLFDKVFDAATKTIPNIEIELKSRK